MKKQYFQENLVGEKLSHSFSTMFSKFTFFELFNPNRMTQKIL